MSEARKEKKKAEELARRREQEVRQRGPEAPAPARLLGSARARRLHPLSLRLAALGSSVLPGRGRPTGRPTTTSAARASRLQRRRFRCVAASSPMHQPPATQAKEVTFKPKVSGYAKHFAHSEHMADRADLLLVEHQERMQVRPCSECPCSECPCSECPCSEFPCSECRWSE